MNKRVLTAATFLTGMLTGALLLAAAERHLPGATNPSSSAVALPDRNPGQDTAVAAPAGPDAPAAGQPAVDPRWQRMDDALARLSNRIATLETRLADLAMTRAGEDTGSRTGATGLDQSTLEAAGLDPVQAAGILQRQSRQEMQRLELRDRANREGWADTERFFEAMRELNGDAASLRSEIGDEAYDRFLYLTGQPNRVMIDSVIEESPAQLAGLQPGDVVIDYADGRVFSWVDLRDATRGGQRGEYIIMRVQRDSRMVEVSVPRGPLGVRMEMEQVNPDEENQRLAQ